MWTALSLTATGLLGLILKSLLNRLGSVGHQVSRLSDKLSALESARQSQATIELPESSLLHDPAIAQAKRRALQKAKNKKHDERQRRLIASLKRYNPNESRFH